MLGKCKYSTSEKGVEIVGHKSLQDIDKNKVSRSLENFQWNDDLQLVCFDYDGNGSKKDLSPDEFIDAIYGIIPQFKSVAKVIKYSSSAHVYNDTGLLSTSNGFHFYFLVNHPEKIKDIFAGSKSWLAKKLVLNGYGFIKNSNPKDVRTTPVVQHLLPKWSEQSLIMPYLARNGYYSRPHRNYRKDW